MIQLNYQDRRPIYEQIVEKMQELIVKGILKQDDKIPSVRSLAIDMSINPNTIQKAYQELERLGFIYTVKGRGNFVSGKEVWHTDKTKEIEEKLESTLKELKALGVKKEEIVKKVDSLWEEV
jgi:GntR family transcriptional regulator